MILFKEMFNSLAKSSAGKYIVNHASKFLLIFGGAGLVGTAWSAALATTKSLPKIEEEKARLGVEKLSIKDTIKLCWKDWIYTVGFMTGSAVSFISAYKIQDAKCIAMATAVGSYEARLAALEKEMVNTLGEKKVAEISDAVAQDIVKEKKIGTDESTAKTRTAPKTRREGLYWCYDPITDQEFLTTYDRITLAIERCDHCLDRDNKNWDEDVEVDLGYFLELAGGKYTQSASRFVWKGSKYSETRVHISATMSDDNEPCYFLVYNNKPEWKA